ncbi:MAG: diacylglycerol kinase family protein [Dehalococcoidia bacterium]|nr:diacylglycerol kinase family protein [Dehalococcoidia bacterium]
MKKPRIKKWNDIGLKYAAGGVWNAFTSGKNLKIYAIAAVMVIILMIWLPTSEIENTILVLTVGLAIAVELINTAIEKAVDISCEDILLKELNKDPINNNAKLAKDISAGAALFTVIIAVIVGIMIFIPKLIDKLPTTLRSGYSLLQNNLKLFCPESALP